MWNLVRPLFTTIKKGEELTHVETWKNAQIAVGALSALLGSGLLLAQAFGVPLPDISDTDLAAIAGGIVALVGVYNGWSTAATSKRVGLPARPAVQEPGGDPAPAPGDDVPSMGHFND